MKCDNCSYYRKNDNAYIKMKEGRIGLLEGDCLLRYMINLLWEINEGEEDDGDEWRV